MNAAPPQAARRPYQYIFGPVPSRRLGLSLGIDLLVPKTCTYDCVFCEAGPTTRRTLERREYAPVRGVLGELAAWLAAGGQADHVTVAGSGEPTLHSGLGQVLDGIRAATRIPSALLTNGSLLHLPDVRADAGRADLVKTSLGAWDDATLRALNRPDCAITHAQVVEGLRAFRREFAGTLWVEVFVVAGINDDPDGMRRIAAILAGVRPDRVHLNTVARPPADRRATAVAEADIRALALLFAPPAEVIARFDRPPARPAAVPDGEIAAMLSRRPCTRGDVAAAFGMDPGEAASRLEAMAGSGVLRREKRGGDTYFMLPKSPDGV